MKYKNRLIVSILLLCLGCASTSQDVSLKAVEEIGPLHVSEFTFGSGDKININVWRHDDLNKTLQVDSNGDIYYLFLGKIHISGMSIHQLRKKLENGLSEFYVKPVVSVEIDSVQSRKIFILGEVKRPGLFTLDNPLNVIEAVAKSGGFTQDAKDESVLVIRGYDKAPELIKLDLEAAISEGELRQNIALQNGDVVYVPATYIANVSRYFKHLDTILRPIVLLEQGIVLGPRVEDVFEGDAGSGDGGTTVIIQGN